MTYEEAKIGQLFTIPGDSEFSFKKLRKYAEVNETGIYTDFVDDQVIEPFGDEPQLSDTVTEVERVAITLLARRSTNHPGLALWIRTMAENPAEMRSLDDFIAESLDDNGERLLDSLQSDGWVVSDNRLMGKRTFAAIMDQKPKGRYIQSAESKAWNQANYTDRITYFLAYALCQYRDAGRPSGDQTSSIMGMGGPLVVVSTSLAAAIVEYHDMMMNYALEQDE